MSLSARVGDLSLALRDKINAMMPRLVKAGGTTGQVLAKASGTNYDVAWVTPAASGGGGTAPVVQRYEYNEADFQLTYFGNQPKPAGATTVRVICVGGGGGGGSGAVGNASTVRTGGGGGAGGGYADLTFPASALATNFYVYVGRGGEASASGSNTSGGAGLWSAVYNNNTSAALVYSEGGGRAAGSSGGSPGIAMYQGGAGTFGGSSSAAQPTAAMGCGAGGAGAGIGSSNAVNTVGGTGGISTYGYDQVQYSTRGTTNSSPDAQFNPLPRGSNDIRPGYGGSGGGAGTTKNGGIGAPGMFPGGGGGGGGSALTGYSSGTGGAGAHGLVLVIWSFG